MHTEDAKRHLVAIHQREQHLYERLANRQPQPGMSSLKRHLLFGLATFLSVGGLMALVVWGARRISAWTTQQSSNNYWDLLFYGGLVMGTLFILGVIIKPFLTWVDQHLNVRLSRQDHIRTLLRHQTSPSSYHQHIQRLLSISPELSWFDLLFLEKLADDYESTLGEKRRLFQSLEKEGMLPADPWTLSIYEQDQILLEHQEKMSKMNTQQYLKLISP